ncbi:MAG: TSUP family transporter, partial [Actinomycetota bacterium]
MILALLGVGLGAAAQTSVGFGLGLVSVAFLVAAVGPAQAIAAILFLSFLTNAMVVAREWQNTVWPKALMLAVPSLAIQLIFAQPVKRLDNQTATLLAGIVVLLAAAMLLSGMRAASLTGGRGLALAGGASALMNMTAGLGGPAAVLYATNAGWQPTMWRPTINLYFMINNAATMLLLDLRPPSDARLYLAAAAGGLVGVAMARQISP